LPLVAVDRASGSVREIRLSSASFDLLFHRLQRLPLTPQAFDLFPDAYRLHLGHVVTLTVGRGLTRPDSARFSGLHLLNALGDFGQPEILVAVS